MVHWLKKQNAQAPQGKAVFAIAALAFLFIQIITFSHDVQADHDVSSETKHCTLCAHAVAKDDITTSPAFEYLVNVLASEHVLVTTARAVDISLVLSTLPRAPPASLS